jgi:hypothetical protein
MGIVARSLSSGDLAPPRRVLAWDYGVSKSNPVARWIGELWHDPLFTKATEQAHKHRLAIDHIVEAVKPIRDDNNLLARMR